MKIINHTLIFFFAVTTISGQNKVNNDTVFNQKVLLEREYNPIIKDASRIESLPQIHEFVVDKTPIQYQFSTLETAFPLQWKTQWPEKKMVVIPKNDKKGFVDLGLGLPTNSLINAGCFLMNSADEKLRLTFDHRLINDQYNVVQTNEKQQIFSTDNLLGARYSGKFNPLYLDLTAAYGRSAFNYFGNYFDNSSVSLKNQVNNTFKLRGEIASFPDSILRYNTSLEYNFFGKKYGALENNKGNGEHNFFLRGEISRKFSGNSRIGLNASLNNFIYSLNQNGELPSYEARNYGLMEFSPYYLLQSENYRVSIGFRSQFEFTNKVNAHLAPNILGSWEFSPRFFLLGKISGGTEVRSFANTDLSCRYIDPSVRLRDTYTTFNSRLSVKTNLYPKFTFELLTEYISGEDYFFTNIKTLYNNPSSWRNTLYPILSKLKQFNIGANFEYVIENIGELRLDLLQHNYTANFNITPAVQETKPLNKPNFELSLSGDFKISDKISAHLNYSLATGRYCLAKEFGHYYIEKMNSINQLSLSGRYMYNKEWSFFSQLNNVLFQKYDIYQGMPVQNFNFIIGVGFSY